MESVQATLVNVAKLLPRLLDGILVTLEVSALSLIWAIGWSLALLALRMSSVPGMTHVVRGYVELARNTPLLLQMYLLYFGLPLLSIPLSAMATGVLAIGLQHGAYLVEIYRAAIRSIGRDQHDAARALGLRPFTAFRLIIFPQALMRVLAPLTNQSIVLVKDTTLVSAITVMDLTLVGKMIAERTAASDAFVVVAAFYLALTSILGLLHRAVEQRYAAQILKDMQSVFFANLPYLLKGAVYTITLSVVTIGLGLLLGALLGVLACYGSKPLKAVIAVYVFVFRGLPVLIVVFLFYYLPPIWGFNLDVYVSAAMALVFYSASFITEIVRGAIGAIPAPQIDAAKSLGLKTMPTLWLIVLPQALRFSLPPLLNNTIMSIKVTSYSSVVGVWELTFAAREVVERTLAAFEIFTGVMAIYFLLCFPLSLLSSRLEHTLSIPSSRREH